MAKVTNNFCHINFISLKVETCEFNFTELYLTSPYYHNNVFLKKDGNMEKFSYDCRVYKSVDD